MKKDKTCRYNKIQRRKIPTLQKCYPSSPFGTDFFSLQGPRASRNPVERDFN